MTPKYLKSENKWLDKHKGAELFFFVDNFPPDTL